MPDNSDAPALTHEQETALRDAILAAIAETPGYYAGPLMGPLVKHLGPAVAQMLAPAESGSTGKDEAPHGRPVDGVLGSLGLDMNAGSAAGPDTGGDEFDFSSLPGADALGPEFVADFKEIVEGIFGAFNAAGDPKDPLFEEAFRASAGAAPQAPPYEKPADLVGGPGTTEPFAIIITDPGDWPYNNAYICDDAAALHRIEHDRSIPGDEVLWAVAEPEEGAEAAYSVRAVGASGVDSEGAWWASVTKALDEAGIPPERRFEGIYY